MSLAVVAVVAREYSDGVSTTCPSGMMGRTRTLRALGWGRDMLISSMKSGDAVLGISTVLVVLDRERVCGKSERKLDGSSLRKDSDEVSMPHSLGTDERDSEYRKAVLMTDALDERLRVADERFSDAEGVGAGAGAGPASSSAGAMVVKR